MKQLLINHYKRSSSIPQNKIKLRQKFREISSQQLPSYREEAAKSAADFFATLPCFVQSKRIACYLCLKTEFDSTPLIETIWREKKYCYVPIVSAKEDDKSLSFVRYCYGDTLRPNRYSILEPIHSKDKINPEELDLVVLPLRAFDLAGHRLGMGGGYYDRTFAFVSKNPVKTPFLLGLGYAQQESKTLPSDPWDVSLDAVLTEKGLVEF